MKTLPATSQTDRCPCGSGLPFEDCCLEAGPGEHRLTAERLETWAAERGLEEALRTVVNALPEGQERVAAALPRWMRSGLTVSQVLQGALPSLPGLERPVRALRRAAWAFLQEEEAALRQALLEEAEPPAWPRDPALRRLAERLRALRAQVRKSAWPRALSQLGRCHLRVLPEARRVKVVDRRRTLRRLTGGLVEPEVELTLARALEEPLQPSRCTCEARLPCDHLLAAIDLTLLHVTDPYPSSDWTALARALETPDWSRALQAIDALQLARRRAASSGQDLRIAFRLATGYGGGVEAAPYLQRRKKDGTFGPGRRANRRDLEEGLDWFAPEDRAALDRLGFLEPLSDPYRPTYGAVSSHAGALSALVGHPRVSLDGTEATRVEVVATELRLAIRPHPQGGLEVAPVVDGADVALEEVRRKLPGGSGRGSFVRLQPERSRCQVVAVADLEATRVILSALSNHGQRFPAEAEGALLDRLGPLQELLPVEVPEGIEGREVAPSEQQVVRLELLEVGLSLEVLARPLDGAPAQPPGGGPTRLLTVRPGGRTFTRRDLPGERARARALLRAAGIEVAEAGPFAAAVADDGQALGILEKLQALDGPGVTVEWIGPKARLVRASSAAELGVAVRDRGDWFGLAGTVEVDGEQVQLALLLEALREKRSVVRLAGGAWLTLTAELAARLSPLAQLSSPAAGGKAPAGEVEIGPSALGALDDLAGDGARLDAKGAFAELRARMRQASKRTPRVPAGFQGKLRDYQVEGFRWLARLASWGAGAVLADDMGLGKTLQALALLCLRAKEGPALVVAPTSVCSNWVAEAGRFAPRLRVTLFREADRAGAVEALGPGDVLVVSYGLLTLDLERFRGKRFATLVLDEAQAIKNAATRRARAVRELTAGFRVGLSGTPVENHLGELWSLYRVVFPGLLGSWEVFKRRFAQPIERDGDDERRRVLSATLRPFLLRRTKAEVARELPTRTEIALPVALSEGERRLYEQARLAIVAKLAGLDEQAPPERRRFQVLAAITQLRLLACHPRLHEAESPLPSSKLARFLELAAELREGGHRTLVFSQFTSHLALVREALDAAGVAYLYLDGQTPPKQRDRLVARFQAGEGELFLISLKAGGTGLNLTAADYVVHLDPWWNPAVEDQATDRAHRIGQKRPVTVYRLLSTGTIEETILTLHARKRSLVAGVLGGMDAAARLSPTALMALIREGAGGPASLEAESVRADVVAEEVGEWGEGLDPV